jgi:subtilisin family serine protease
MRWRTTSRRLAVLGVVVLGATFAQVGGQAWADPPDGAAGAASVRGGLTQVTLITGDVVAFAPQPDGKDTGFLVKRRPGVRYQVLSGPNSFYVLPSDALPLISANTVDRELFNVGYLARNGYGEQPDLPVIIKGAYPATTSFQAASAGRELPSIGATSTRIAKARAGEFWQSVAPTSGKQSRTLASGVTKVLLDRRVQATLAESVAQIHAPEAWAAGADGKGVRVAVLDSGIDVTHPDLAGKVVDSRSFVAAEPDVVDRHGHGTHVASTVAGTGAASGGREKGAAPGADLVIGKVLNKYGLGYDSDVIAGMEWAAKTAHARVISMSLGAPVDQGEDVQAEAVHDLTASTGALFVVAAGNSGPNRATLMSPGIAPDALTVGAVDNADQTADFSSHGPGPDGGVKPEITAPGVQILAARAAGTNPSFPADQRYIAMSGTSMATPHVAGAAAVLAQRHPDWTANTLKSALVSSSKDLGRPPVEQGAGRADVFAALSQTTTARPASLAFGALTTQTGAQNQTVTYHNDGTAPVILTIDAKLGDLNGTPTPAGTLVTSAAQVTVPAGGDASVPVVLTPGKVGAGSYQGMITARSTDGRVRVVTPVGFSNGPVAHRTTIQVLGYDGKVRQLLGQDLWYLALDTPSPNWTELDFSAGRRDLLLARGRYLMVMFVHGEDASAAEMTAVLVKPDVAVTADSTQTFDLRNARPVRVDAPEPVLAQGTDVMLRRATDTGDEYRIFTHVGQDDRSLLYLDTGPPVPGFSFDYLTALTRSQLDLTVGSLTVHPSYVSPDGGDNTYVPGPVKMFDGARRAGVVYVGEGGEADFAGKDVRGKLVLAQRATLFESAIDIAERANAGGAAGVTVFDSEHRTTMSVYDGHEILPVTYLSRPDGLRLLDQITRGHNDAKLFGTPVSPFSYHLIDSRRPAMPPEGLTLTVDPRKMVRYDTTYHAPAGASINSAMTMTDGQPLPDGDFLRAPTHRVDYYGPVKPGALLQRFVIKEQLADFLYLASAPEPMYRPANRSDSWNVMPRRPGQATFEAIAQPQSLMLSRTGDTLYFTPQVVDGRDHRDVAAPNPDEMSVRLSRDGVTLPWTAGAKSVAFPVPKERGRYAFDVYFTPKVMAPEGYRTETRWEFGSSAPTASWPASPYSCGDADAPAAPGTPCATLPALALDYQLGTGPAETFAAPGVAAITVGAREAPGVTGARVDRIAAEVSYDGGKSWQKLWLLPGPGGRKVAFVPHWSAGATVSLRLTANDTAGNKVTQTIVNAYRLVARQQP